MLKQSVLCVALALAPAMLQGQSIDRGLYFPGVKGGEARTSIIKNAGSRVLACSVAKAAANTWAEKETSPLAYYDGKLFTPAKRTSVSECDCEKLDPAWPSWADEKTRKDHPELAKEQGFNCSVDARVNWVKE